MDVDDNFKKIVGNNLKKFRKAANLTRQQVADKLNVSDRTVGHYETGYHLPNLEQLEILSKLYNKSKSEILGEADIPITKKDKDALENIISMLIQDGSLLNKKYDDLDDNNKTIIVGALNRYIDSMRK